MGQVSQRNILHRATASFLVHPFRNSRVQDILKIFGVEHYCCPPDYRQRLVRIGGKVLIPHDASLADRPSNGEQHIPKLELWSRQGLMGVFNDELRETASVDTPIHDILHLDKVDA